MDLKTFGNSLGKKPETWIQIQVLPLSSKTCIYSRCTAYCHVFKGLPGGSDSKVSAYNAGDPGSIPGLGRSPGEGNGNPLQYSCLKNPMEGGAW